MVLCFDIESSSTTGKINVEDAIFKTIAFYEYETNKYSFYTYKDIEEIKKVFKKHRIIISYYGNKYDIPILNKNGINTKNNTHIDLYEVMKKRGVYLGIKNISLSLQSVAKHLKLTTHKDENFDYNILNKNEWTEEEINHIKNYNIQDVKVTKELYDKTNTFFLPFKEYVSENDKHNMSWLTSSIPTLSYKIICHQAGLIEEYVRNPPIESYEGGFVAEPSTNEAHGNILAFDFSSLYPNIFIQCNLFSNQCNCCENKEKWNGDGFFNVKGRYCTRNQGVIEKTVNKLFLQRLEYKKVNDPREYAIKIIINSLYGIVGFPVFKNIHDYTTASDCTSIARDCVKFAAKIFEDFGFKVLYMDTDSNYIQVPDGKTSDDAVTVANYITKKLQEHMVFPSKEFVFKVDEEIKHMFFFKNGGSYVKKLYVYVTKNDELVVKGLPFIKSDSSGIGGLVFEQFMKQTIITTGRIEFDYYDILKWAYDLLEQDKTIALRTFKVGPVKNYKLDTQLQAQISKKYGPGRHQLIPNNKIGVGEGTKLCTMKEFNEAGLTIEDIDLSKFWKEMRYFCEIPAKERTQRAKKQLTQKLTLLKWFGI